MARSSSFKAPLGGAVRRSLEAFPPARFLTGLVSQDHERGFVVLTVALIEFGLSCFLWPVRRGRPSAVNLAWAWVVVETINGVGHAAWTLRQRGYTPGVATAPVLLVLAVDLARQLWRATASPSATVSRG